jgi:hypothetical protein
LYCLKAFIAQKECVKQLKDKENIKKIAKNVFKLSRALVELDDDDVSKEIIEICLIFFS